MVKDIIIDLDKCNGDGICVDNCPVNVFELNEKTGKAKVVNLEECIECLTCQENCPEEAIKVVEDD
ncbi:MAG: ferredoxin family protein [Promethearchaeota archaeon]